MIRLTTTNIYSSSISSATDSPPTKSIKAGDKHDNSNLNNERKRQKEGAIRFIVGQQRTGTMNEMRTMQGLEMSPRYVLFSIFLLFIYFNHKEYAKQSQMTLHRLLSHQHHQRHPMPAHHYHHNKKPTVPSTKQRIMVAWSDRKFRNNKCVHLGLKIYPKCHHEITQKHSSSSAEGKKGPKTTSSACTSHLLTMKSLLLTMVTTKTDSGRLVFFFSSLIL